VAAQSKGILTELYRRADGVAAALNSLFSEIHMQWTIERLRSRSPHERHQLYMNACAKAHTVEGAALRVLIEESGLPFSDDAALKMDDPISLKMIEIIFSSEGRQAALNATDKGEPAMLGIDPLLSAALGVDYGAHNRGTVTAGAIVGALMRQLGFENAGQKPLPDYCIAKTAETWRRR
jgi:hypothetical protein